MPKMGKEEFGAALAKHGLGLSSPAADQENREVVSATPVPPELENGQAQGGQGAQGSPREIILTHAHSTRY